MIYNYVKIIYELSLSEFYNLFKFYEVVLYEMGNIFGF